MRDFIPDDVYEAAHEYSDGTFLNKHVYAVAMAIMAERHRGESKHRVLARPLDDWHEDYGPCVWWKFPVDEPSWIGTPCDNDWPGYHTHWTPHPDIPTCGEAPDTP